MKIACFSLPKSFLETSEKTLSSKYYLLSVKSWLNFLFLARGEYVLRTHVKTWSWYRIGFQKQYIIG